MNYQCTLCQIRAFDKLIQKHDFSEEEKTRMLQEFLGYLSAVEHGKKAPEIGREVHAKIREFIDDPDPYNEVKYQSNTSLLQRYNEFKDIVLQSKDRFETALRLAIAGNIIDFGPGVEYDIDETIRKVLNSDFKINHSEELKRDMQSAHQILYLGDNAGEIVLDKLFIENFGHPNVYFAVRGSPVINDATFADAELVNMQEVATVISNDFDAPSTLIEKSSDKFREIYENSDLIISKGMGNLEGLLDARGKNIFFLLMVKCQLIGDKLAVDKGDFVVKQSDYVLANSLT